MPNRPRSHQLEDESRRGFCALLPPNWVVRDVTPDYGVDLSVEVFDEAGTASGLTFNVQIRATDSANERIARRLRLAKTQQAYLATLDSPVLLVRYHSPGKRFYSQFLHEWSSSSPPSQSVVFRDEHQWTDQTGDAIVATLKQYRRFTRSRLEGRLRAEEVRVAAIEGELPWVAFADSGAEGKDIEYAYEDLVLFARGLAFENLGSAPIRIGNIVQSPYATGAYAELFRRTDLFTIHCQPSRDSFISSRSTFFLRDDDLQILPLERSTFHVVLGTAHRTMVDEYVDGRIQFVETRRISDGVVDLSWLNDAHYPEYVAGAALALDISGACIVECEVVATPQRLYQYCIEWRMRAGAVELKEIVSLDLSEYRVEYHCRDHIVEQSRETPFDFKSRRLPNA